MEKYIHQYLTKEDLADRNGCINTNVEYTAKSTPSNNDKGFN